MSRSNLLSVRFPFRSALSLGRRYLPTYNSGYGVTQRQTEGFTDYKDGRGREQYGGGLRLSQGIRCMPEAMKCTKEFVMAKT